MTPRTRPALADRMISVSNDLIRASQGLGLNEKRLISCCAAKLAGSQSPDGMVRIHAEELEAVYGLGIKNAYTALKKASDGLWKAVIVPADLVELRWLYQRGNYVNQAGYVELYLSAPVVKKLTDHSANFTCYRLSQTRNIRCVYTYRLFELLCSWQAAGRLHISVADLRRVLEIPTSYKLNKIYKHIINVSLPVISESLNAEITFIEIKEGRSVTGWDVFINKK